MFLRSCSLTFSFAFVFVSAALRTPRPLKHTALLAPIFGGAHTAGLPRFEAHPQVGQTTKGGVSTAASKSLARI
jgi:hypothetical protein